MRMCQRIIILLNKYPDNVELPGTYDDFINDLTEVLSRNFNVFFLILIVYFVMKKVAIELQNLFATSQAMIVITIHIEMSFRMSKWCIQQQ